MLKFSSQHRVQGPEELKSKKNPYFYPNAKEQIKCQQTSFRSSTLVFNSKQNKKICTDRFNFSFGIKQGRVAAVVVAVVVVAAVVAAAAVVVVVAALAVVVVAVAAAIITLTIFQKTLPSLGCVQFRG